MALSKRFACKTRQVLQSLPVYHIPRRRYASAYGYEQARALIFHDYGDPKDVLRWGLFNPLEYAKV